MGRKIKLSENIGLQLKEFRTKYKVKGKDIAELLGKSPAYVSKLEKGQIQQIEKDELVKITNYITQSNEGYYLFCEKIAEAADVKELDHDIWLMNFDLVDRKLPVPIELVKEIKQRMMELDITSEALATYINQNEDLTFDFLLEHRIDPNAVEKNVWMPYQEADSVEHPHSIIFLEVKGERIQSLIDGKIKKCEYMFPYAIMYHLLKWKYKKQGKALDDSLRDSCKIKAEEILLNYKFYSLSVQARCSEQSSSEEEYEKILNEFDINNMEYISAILSEISFLSKYDVSYTNEKLKSIVENMEKCDSSFVLAYMSLSLIGIKDLQTSIKKNFLQDVVNLIKEYSIMADTGENIERY